MHRWSLVLLATGCFQPGAATGVPCSVALECPTGQVCDRSGPVPICSDRAVDASGGTDAPRDSGTDPGPDAFVPLACPAGYQAIAGSATKYRESLLPATWEAAAADCADDGARTHLVVVANELERGLLQGQSAALRWIGLSDRRTEGVFRWLTAEPTNNYPPASGAPWAPGEPSGGADVDCVYLNPFGAFESEPCVGFLSYLCECDAFANDPTAY